MGYLWMLLVLAVLPLPFMRLLHTSFARALPAALACALLLLLAAAALLGSLPMAMILVGAVFAAAAALSLLLCNDRPALLRRYLRPDFAVFCIIFTGIYLFYGTRHFIWWDEWSHWGLMVKGMCLFDKLYTDPSVWMPVHKDYPISITLFGYVWCRLSGGYSEAGALRSLYTFCAAMLLPLFSGKEIKYRHLWKPLLAVSVCFLCITAADNAGFPFTYYMDAPAGLVFGLLVWLALRMDFKKTRDYVPVFFLLAFLPLIKEIGVLLALVAAAIFLCCFVTQALAAKREGKPLRVWPCVPPLLAAFALPALSFAAWRGYVKGLGIGGQFQLEPAPLREILAAFVGRGTAFQTETLLRFWKGFLFVAQRYAMPLWALLLALILAGAFYLRRTKDAESLPRFRAAAPVYMLGYAAFALALLYLYLFGGFSVSEANRLASMDRYLGCYATAMAALAAGIYYDYRLSRPPGKPTEDRKEKRKRRALAVFLVAAMALRPSPALATPLAGHMDLAAKALRPWPALAARLAESVPSADFARDAVDACRDRLNPETDRVYMVQEKNSQRLFQFVYHLYPVRCSPAGQSKLNPEKLSARDIRKRWAEGGYTHLIIAEDCEIFKGNFPALFACAQDEIQNGALFLIDYTGGEAVLRPATATETHRQMRLEEKAQALAQYAVNYGESIGMIYVDAWGSGTIAEIKEDSDLSNYYPWVHESLDEFSKDYDYFSVFYEERPYGSYRIRISFIVM